MKDFNKVLENRIRQSKADYDLYRQNAVINALSRGGLNKYECLTNNDLQIKPNPIEKPKFEYSPLGQVFNKGLEKDEKQKGLLKRLKNIEDKTDNQLRAIEDQGNRELERIEGINDFYYGKDKKIIDIQNKAIYESIQNMINKDNVFSVKINKEPFRIDKYTNLAYFGNLLLKNIIPLEKAEEQQKKILIIINDLENKIAINKKGRPLSKENKDDAEI